VIVSLLAAIPLIVLAFAITTVLAAGVVIAHYLWKENQ
jgi:hypothetical protein